MATQRLGDEQIRQRLDKSITSLDQHRTTGLIRTQLLQTNKDKALRKERVRLEKKYGTNHPRVAKIVNRLDYNQAVLPEIETEIALSQIKVPEFDANTWMMHGRVFCQNGNPQPNLAVSLYDEEGQWIKEYGYACTNDLGYFSIQVEGTEGAECDSASEKPLYLTVTDSSFKVLHRETRPFYLAVGIIDYRRIVLKDTVNDCTPPKSSDTHSRVPLPEDGWVVKGRVLDKQKKPLSGLTITLYDKDLFFDDVLGTTIADKNGEFIIIYRTEAFRDFFEKRPDIYLKVLDQEGKTLFSSRQ